MNSKIKLGKSLRDELYYQQHTDLYGRISCLTYNHLSDKLDTQLRNHLYIGLNNQILNRIYYPTRYDLLNLLHAYEPKN